MSRGLEVVNKCLLILDTLAKMALEDEYTTLIVHLPATTTRTSVLLEQVNVVLVCTKASTIWVHRIFSLILNSHGPKKFNRRSNRSRGIGEEILLGFPCIADLRINARGIHSRFGQFIGNDLRSRSIGGGLLLGAPCVFGFRINGSGVDSRFGQCSWGSIRSRVRGGSTGKVLWLGAPCVSGLCFKDRCVHGFRTWFVNRAKKVTRRQKMSWWHRSDLRNQGRKILLLQEWNRSWMNDKMCWWRSCKLAPLLGVRVARVIKGQYVVVVEDCG